MRDDRRWILLTNNPLIVDFVMDTGGLDYNSIHIYDMKQEKYVPIENTTPKHLRRGNIFSKLWLGDAFENTKNIKV